MQDLLRPQARPMLKRGGHSMCRQLQSRLAPGPASNSPRFVCSASAGAGERLLPSLVSQGDGAGCSWAPEVAPAVHKPRAETLPEPLLSVAPMMEYTDTHFRHLARLLSRKTTLWTEMVVDSTIVYNPEKLDRWLGYTTAQHPVVLQLGGSNVKLLAQAAKLATAYGYDEINLNCGCPSPKVAGDGCFGASLMLRPDVVADACAAMAYSSGTPVTVKCRIGVDDNDSYEELVAFVGECARRGGVKHFIVHARKALLDGLSPEQNRKIPPLKYDVVRRLAGDFPDLKFSLNGGLLSLTACANELWPEAAAAAAAEGRLVSAATAGAAASSSGRQLYGTMVGRAVWDRSWDMLADADRRLWGAENPATSRRQVLAEYADYADEALRSQRFGPGHPTVRALMKPLLNLFTGAPRSRTWKSLVDEELKKSGKRGKEDVTVRSILEKTLAVMPEEVLDAPPPQTDLPPVKREPRSGEASDSEGEGGARDGKQQQREAAAVG